MSKKQIIQPGIDDLAELIRARATEPGVANLYKSLFSLVSEVNGRLGYEFSIEPLNGPLSRAKLGNSQP